MMTLRGTPEIGLDYLPPDPESQQVDLYIGGALAGRLTIPAPFVLAFHGVLEAGLEIVTRAAEEKTGSLSRSS